MTLPRQQRSFFLFSPSSWLLSRVMKVCGQVSESRRLFMGPHGHVDTVHLKEMSYTDILGSHLTRRPRKRLGTTLARFAWAIRNGCLNCELWTVVGPTATLWLRTGSAPFRGVPMSRANLSRVRSSVFLFGKKKRK